MGDVMRVIFSLFTLVELPRKIIYIYIYVRIEKK